MKLTELEQPNGTYAAVNFSKGTINNIVQYIKNNKIPNPVDPDTLHTTLLSSRKYLPDYEPTETYDEPMSGKPVKFEKWPTHSDDNVNMCLVLRYTCNDLLDRHNELMKEHGATYDYDEYKPHVTLSYDVGGLQVKDLPEFTQLIEIIGEYSEELTED